MMCGSKCFLVELKLGETKQIKQVIARSPIGARKVIRRKYGDDADIVSVKEDKRKP